MIIENIKSPNDLKSFSNMFNIISNMDDMTIGFIDDLLSYIGPIEFGLFLEKNGIISNGADFGLALKPNMQYFSKVLRPIGIEIDNCSAYLLALYCRKNSFMRKFIFDLFINYINEYNLDDEDLSVITPELAKNFKCWKIGVDKYKPKNIVFNINLEIN